MDLTVATFNLRNHLAKDGSNAWTLRRDQVAEMIRRTGAVLIGTQEGYLEQLTDLAARLPGYAWIGRGRRGDDADEHCAVFYRVEALRPVEVGHFWLSEAPDVAGSSSWDTSLPRMCTWGRFAVAGTAQEILFFNTHLDHRGQKAREQGIRLICARLAAARAATGLPAVLVGDLNAGEDSAVVRFLREESGLTDAYDALDRGPDGRIGATFHGFGGGDRGALLDYIFASPPATFVQTAVRREMIDGRYPSDHYPVVAQLRLP